MNAKRKKLIYNSVTFGIVILAYVLCSSLYGSMSRSLRGQLIPICCWIVMAVSLNLVVGISGELSLGHAGFMSLGAFSGIVVSGWMLNGFQMENEILRLVIAMAAGGLVAGIFGVLIGIPVLRLRGDYLAIVTLAFGEIIRNVMNCVYASVEGKRLVLGFLNPSLPGKLLLNGPNGAVSVGKIATFGAGFILILVTLTVVLNLINSRTGRAIMATRDNRIAAESVGINVTKYKMIAFVTAAVLAGMAGALYGLNYSTLIPGKFKFDQSINVLVFVVLGGIGNTLGSVISATVLTMLPELLREFSDYRMLVYALLLIAMMLITNTPASRAVLNNVKGMFRRRNLHQTVQATQGTGKEKGGRQP
ncbi:MAG: branched-chain amino acid ABC transporter permease [Clostridia bacterium]|nr:branched-chain amino acid ABC transporter permease [Clostridia bacterium]